MQPGDTGRLCGNGEHGRDVGRLVRRVERRVVVRAIAAPDAVGFEARRRQRHPSALLEAAVGLDRDVERRRDLRLAAVERVPAEDVGHVLPPDLEAEDPLQEAAPLDVAVHQVDLLAVQARDERGRRRRVRLAAADAVVGVVAEARAEEELRRVGVVQRLVEELVARDGERRREATAGQHRLAGRRAHVVELRVRVALDVGVDGPGRARVKRAQARTRDGEARPHPPPARSETRVPPNSFTSLSSYVSATAERWRMTCSASSASSPFAGRSLTTTTRSPIRPKAQFASPLPLSSRRRT